MAKPYSPFKDNYQTLLATELYRRLQDFKKGIRTQLKPETIDQWTPNSIKDSSALSR